MVNKLNTRGYLHHLCRRVWYLTQNFNATLVNFPIIGCKQDAMTQRHYFTQGLHIFFA